MAATASHPDREIDWYVITDEADLTLRIANGLRVGEDRWGELTLNHPVAAHRWLEFTIEQDGALTCRPCRRDVVIEIDGEAQALLQLQPGDPIQLPHNRVHISDSFKRGPSDAPAAVVRCVEVDESAEDAGVPTLEQIVITESDLAQIRVNTEQQPDRNNTLRYQNALADKLAERVNVPEARSTRRGDSIETALIPVDAESPFAANEVSESLKRPIGSEPKRAVRRAANSPVMTPPLSRSAAPPRRQAGLETAERERRSYTYLWSLSAILGVGLLAAILVAINSGPGRDAGNGSTAAQAGAETSAPTTPSMPTRTEELLSSVQNIIARSPEDDPAAWEFAVRSYEYILAQEPENSVVRRRLAAARTRVASLKARAEIRNGTQANVSGAAADGATAAAPAEAASEVGTSLQSSAAELDQQPVVTATTTTSSPTVSGENTDRSTVGNRLTQEPIASPAQIEPERRSEEPFSLPAGTHQYGPPLSAEQIDSRLRLARQRLGEGEIISPLGSSASALTLSVLATDPTHTEAINLLNACADVMLNQAELAYQAGESFQARNTLEEILAFHPRHRRANERWQQWTGASAPSRYR